MNKEVLFTSNRSLERAENLNTVWNAYNGTKEFKNFSHNPQYNKYALQVTDELVNNASQKCIFIGHALGAGKKYGLDQPHQYFYHPELLTYAITSSVFMVPIVAAQCGIDESRVFPLGTPRTDAYVNYRKQKSSYKIYLYAPTFRAKGEGTVSVDWNYLDTHLNDDEIIIVKPHPVQGGILKGEYEHIVEYSAYRPTTPFLLRADVVITDYSSIMFDAYVAKIPVVLFEKDHDSYLKNRGMYFPYPDMYSPWHCVTEDELLVMCRDIYWDKRFEALRHFYAEACDGHSTERVLEVIYENINSDSNI